MKATNDVAGLVANHRLLTGLPGDAVGRLAGCARNVAFAPGQLLLTEGDPADALYLLRRGHVSLEVHAPGRGPLVIETIGPGEAVGWSWLFPPYRWQFDGRALDAVGAVAVDGSCLRAKAEADPKFGYELMKRFLPVMLERLQAARVRLLDLYGRGPAGGPPASGQPLSGEGGS
jgi:CRP/FNR family cyclic AMP-dependent transcriptional regulator